MTKFFFSLLLAISYWLFAGGTASAALAPLFEPGGQACSRTADYQDRSSPGCYVTKGGTSTYNLYIPDPQSSPPRGQDPNVSETCFVVSRPLTDTKGAGYTPGYELLKDFGITPVSTAITQWPWDIPQEDDYKTIAPIQQFFADTFGLQGTTRRPPSPQPQILVDQYGPLEKLQPLLFQVKDRVDYCKLFEAKQVFDETIDYSLNGVNKSAPLSQVCAAIPAPIRQLANLPDNLKAWYEADPDMAEAFHRLTPYIQQDQVAWMRVCMYPYQYEPVDGPRTINPQSTDCAFIKLNLAGLSRYTQAEQRLNDSLIPSDLQSDTPIPSGFPITNPSQLSHLEDQVSQAMTALGYDIPFDCDLPSPEGEFEPGPPTTTTESLWVKFKRFISQALNIRSDTYDAELGTKFVGRCTPGDWTKVFDAEGHHIGWTCTVPGQALANVYLLNPEYLRATCQDFYLDPAGYLRAHFPQTLIDQSLTNTNTTTITPPQEKPLLPTFLVFPPPKGTVSSPGNPPSANEVYLPTVCQGELALAKNQTLLRQALRPQDFRDPRNTIQVYLGKFSPTSPFLSTVTNFIRSLFSPGH